MFPKEEVAAGGYFSKLSEPFSFGTMSHLLSHLNLKLSFPSENQNFLNICWAKSLKGSDEGFGLNH